MKIKWYSSVHFLINKSALDKNQIVMSIKCTLYQYILNQRTNQKSNTYII